MIKAVFFDCGNTLVDMSAFGEISNETDLKLIKSLGFNPSLKEVKEAANKADECIFKNFLASSKRHDVGLFFYKICENLGIKIDMKIAIEMDEKWWEEIMPHLKLFPDTIEILEFLKGKYILAVVSNGHEEKLKEILEKLGLTGYFDLIVASHVIGVEKCASDPIKYALEKLKLKPEEVIMVGDREDQDIIGANKLGMKTVKIVHKGLEPKIYGETVKADYEINSLIELKDILKKLS